MLDAAADTMKVVYNISILPCCISIKVKGHCHCCSMVDSDVVNSRLFSMRSSFTSDLDDFDGRF